MGQRKQVDRYTGPLTLGLDVSRYQGDIVWSKLASRFKFVFIRTGDGRGEDAKFDRNWQGAGEIGLPRGVYHYFRADRDGLTQASMVADMVTAAGGITLKDLPPVIDIEGGTALNLPAGVFDDPSREELPIELIVDECLEFLNTLEVRLGMRPIVYTGQAFHWWLSQAKPELAKKFEKYPLWIASYNDDAPYMPVDKEGKGFPWTQWTFWQFTSKGTSSGITGSIDMNYFRGDEKALKEFIVNSHPASIAAPVFVTAANNERIKVLLQESMKQVSAFMKTVEELQKLLP